MTDIEYRDFLIEGILELQTEGIFKKEELEKKPIRVLEKIYDNVK